MKGISYLHKFCNGEQETKPFIDGYTLGITTAMFYF